MDKHPFIYPTYFDVCASDSYGNFTPLMRAEDGQAFKMTIDSSGVIFKLASTPATNPNEVEIRNNLVTGAINAMCFKDGRIMALESLAPEQKAEFEFNPIIHIGIVSQIEEGDVLNYSITSEIHTQINLLGINNADIVMTGGGSGPNAVPFAFTLENINMD
jgi:hypothetical protein